MNFDRFLKTEFAHPILISSAMTFWHLIFCSLYQVPTECTMSYKTQKNIQFQMCVLCLGGCTITSKTKIHFFCKKFFTLGICFRDPPFEKKGKQCIILQNWLFSVIQLIVKWINQLESQFSIRLMKDRRTHV